MIRGERGEIGLPTVMLLAVGGFSFLFGIGAGMNGIDHPQPTETKVTFTVPYDRSTGIKCVGKHMLRLTVAGNELTLPTQDCQKEYLKP